jgi:hypothetical protein
MLVNPRIEHVDSDDDVQTMHVHLVDVTGETQQIYFTSAKDLLDFVTDVRIALEGDEDEPSDIKQVKARRNTCRSSRIH